MTTRKSPHSRRGLADIFRALPVIPLASAFLPTVHSPGRSPAGDEERAAKGLQFRGSKHARSVRLVPLAAVLLGAFATATAAEGQTARQSWTADRRDFAEGDVITVLIDEYTLAAANRGNFASDRRFRDLGVAAGQSISSSLPSGAAEVSSSNQNESRQRDEATRQNRFQGEMTVRVVGIEPGGLLQVQGTKTLNIDGAVERLTLTGLIRAQDVGDLNMVESWRISDTELVYDTRGNKPRGGIIGRILGAIWP